MAALPDVLRGFGRRLSCVKSWNIMEMVSWDLEGGGGIITPKFNHIALRTLHNALFMTAML